MNTMSIGLFCIIVDKLKQNAKIRSWFGNGRDAWAVGCGKVEGSHFPTFSIFVIASSFVIVSLGSLCHGNF